MNFNNNGTYSPFKADLKTLIITKIKINHICKVCDKDIPKGSYCLGGQYFYRICLDCANDYFENAEASVKQFLELIKQNKEEFTKNKDKFKINNLSASI